MIISEQRMKNIIKESIQKVLFEGKYDELYEDLDIDVKRILQRYDLPFTRHATEKGYYEVYVIGFGQESQNAIKELVQLGLRITPRVENSNNLVTYLTIDFH